MQDLDYDHTVHSSDAGDSKLSVLFYNSFVKDESESLKEGRFVAKDTPFVKIFPPGDRTNIIDRPVRESDKLRFPQQWARFKNAQEQRADGTPIAEWPIVSRGQAEELKYLGFSTVEQIAGANDNVNFMGLQDLKQKAKLYLEIAKGNTAGTESLVKENAEMKANMKVMEEAMAVMKTQIASISTAKAVK